jgi:hypothetical protein
VLAVQFAVKLVVDTNVAPATVGAPISVVTVSGFEALLVPVPETTA